MHILVVGVPNVGLDVAIYLSEHNIPVVDYAFYQAAYLNDLRSEKEYFDYLGQNYAEDPMYVSKLKKIIEKTTE